MKDARHGLRVNGKTVKLRGACLHHDEVCDMWTKMKGYEDFPQYFHDNWRQVVATMVEEDRVHPCVVGYSSGNEISDICTDKGVETSHELYAFFPGWAAAVS